ncbi:hypothetical protein Ancab_007540 [Ancistrocladus abbreviatus]
MGGRKVLIQLIGGTNSDLAEFGKDNRLRRWFIEIQPCVVPESDEEAMNAGQVSSAFLPREPNLEIFNPNPSINELTKNVQKEPQNNDDHLEFEFCKGKRRICRRECRWEGGAKPGVPVVGEEKQRSMNDAALANLGDRYLGQAGNIVVKKGTWPNIE